MSAAPVPPAAPQEKVSPQEYLRRERLAEFRSEYHAGFIVPMAATNRIHNRIKTNLSVSLGNQLRDRRCNNYSSDMRVSVRGGKSYLYPDIVVTCGKEEFEDDQLDTLVNPIAIIEVLSTSTEGHDRGFKFLAYQTIPSLQEYVLITPSPRRFEVYRRQPDGSWLYHSWAFSPPPLALQSIGCTLTPEDVYLKVEDEAGSGTKDDESGST
jgi:Uma2 family endonuclease